MTWNCSLAQHTDSREYSYTIGFFSALNTSKQSLGHFTLSRHNTILPFNPHGHVIVWNAQSVEHGSTLHNISDTHHFGAALVQEQNIVKYLQKKQTELENM